MDSLWKQRVVQQLENSRLEEFTLDELAKYDGKDGRPAYIAINGMVYDVSGYATWADGSHYDLIAGTDATEGFRLCHNHTILERVKLIGRLVG